MFDFEFDRLNPTVTMELNGVDHLGYVQSLCLVQPKAKMSNGVVRWKKKYSLENRLSLKPLNPLL